MSSLVLEESMHPCGCNRRYSFAAKGLRCMIEARKVRAL